MPPFDNFNGSDNNEKQFLMTAYNPDSGQSVRATGYTAENMNADLIGKGYITSLSIVDGGGSGQSNKPNFAIGQDNRSINGSESGSKEKSFNKGLDDRAGGSTESGLMQRKGSGIGPDNRSADGSGSSTEPRIGREIGQENPAAHMQGAGDNKNMKLGQDNKVVEGSQSGQKVHGPDNDREKGIMERIYDVSHNVMKQYMKT